MAKKPRTTVPCFNADERVDNYLALLGARTEVLQIVANDTSRVNAFCDGQNMGAITTPATYTIDSYRPLVTSTTIVNQGTATGAPTVDFLGRTRTGGIDIGAYEYLP